MTKLDGAGGDDSWLRFTGYRMELFRPRTQTRHQIRCDGDMGTVVGWFPSHVDSVLPPTTLTTPSAYTCRWPAMCLLTPNCRVSS